MLATFDDGARNGTYGYSSASRVDPLLHDSVEESLFSSLAQIVRKRLPYPMDTEVAQGRLSLPSVDRSR